MFAVYMVVDGIMGEEEVMVQDGFATEEQAQAFVAELEAADVAEYGEVVDPYYVGEAY